MTNGRRVEGDELFPEAPYEPDGYFTPLDALAPPPDDTPFPDEEQAPYEPDAAELMADVEIVRESAPEVNALREALGQTEQAEQAAEGAQAGNGKAKPTEAINISDLELEVLYITCHDATATQKFMDLGLHWTMLHQKEVRHVVKAAQELRKANPPILPDRAALFAKGAATLAELDNWAYFCDSAMLERKTGIATAIVNAHMLYELEMEALNLLADARKAKIFDAESIAKKYRDKMDRIRSKVRPDVTSGVGVGHIGRRLKNNPRAVRAPISTGFAWFDYYLRGGLKPGAVYAIGGPMKQGKTTVVRNIAKNVAMGWTSNGIWIPGKGVVHIAHDGGDDEEHYFYYIAMLAQQQAVAKGAPTQIKVKGSPNPVDIITPEVVEFAITGQLHLLNFTIPPSTFQCIQDAFDTMDTWDAEDPRAPGFLHLYDSRKVLGDIDWCMSILEREVEENGAQVIIIDHLLKLADPTDFGKSVPKVVYKLTQFVNSHHVALVVLSQVTTDTMRAKEKDVERYDAGLKYAQDLQAEAHAVFTTMIDETMDDKLRVILKLARKSKQGQNVYKDFYRHAQTGLIWQ